MKKRNNKEQKLVAEWQSEKEVKLDTKKYYTTRKSKQTEAF